LTQGEGEILNIGCLFNGNSATPTERADSIVGSSLYCRIVSKKLPPLCSALELCGKLTGHSSAFLEQELTLHQTGKKFLLPHFLPGRARLGGTQEIGELVNSVCLYGLQASSIVCILRWTQSR
jgi:hypothetical protein